MATNFADNLEKAFKEECKVIDLKQEYMHYTEDIRWAIATDISEEELREKYEAIIEKYEPFLLLTKEQYLVMINFHSNNRKHKKRNAELGDAFNYEDGRLEMHHSELLNKQLSEENQDILHLNKALKKLTKSQRERLIKHFAEDMTCVEIAKKEGVSPQAVQQSIARAIATLKKILLDD